MAKEKLSNAEARRIALAAGGFGRPAPSRVDAGLALRVISRLGLLQIDSVNVVARAHEMPLWSRLGNAWNPDLLLRLAHRERRLFEYWGHEASFIPTAFEPSFRWRKEEVRSGQGRSANMWWGRWTRAHEDLLSRTLQEVRERGPLAASDLATGSRNEAWWGWQEERKALEWLYSAGIVAVSGRRASFEREFDLSERVFPPEVLAAPAPDPDDAKRELLRIALRACGVATLADLADHFRMGGAEARRLLPDLVETGDAVPATVEGWKAPAYLDPTARIPRSVAHDTLLSPFDPLVWNRDRAERLFGFHYRIEIYVPAAKRVHGYYVLPVLQDEALTARLDVKADRKAGVLRVLAAWSEPKGPDLGRLHDTLRRFAAWRGLSEIVVAQRGDLAGALRSAVAPARRNSRS